MVGLAAITSVGVFVALWFALNAYIDPSAADTHTDAVAARAGIVDELVKIAGGLVITLGACFAGLTYRLNRNTQTTERFAQAIEQLGALDDDGKPQLELRLGGIYTLERLAQDSERDHWPVMEVLTAYVREHAPWTIELMAATETGVARRPEKLTADIQAALTVIGRRKYSRDREPRRYIDLSLTNLQWANLISARLDRAQLLGANLEGARLTRAYLNASLLSMANLKNAYLVGAHLEKATFEFANMDGAKLWDAHLEGAGLAKANLTNAELTGAQLSGADLREANMSGTNLSGANLKGALNLTVDQLKLAIVNATTRLPAALAQELAKHDEPESQQ